MNESTRAVIQSTFEASNQGAIHFGQVIGQLVEAGVESYHVDYRSALPMPLTVMPCALPSWVLSKVA